MTNKVALQATIRQCAAEAATIYSNPTLSTTAKSRRLDQLEVTMKTANDQLASAARLDAATYATMNDLSQPTFGAPSAPLGLDEDALHDMYDAIRSHKSWKGQATVKDVSSLVPPTLMPGVVGVVHEPTRVLEVIGSFPTETPAIEYIQHLSTAGTAGTVAAGALKPAVTLTTAKILAIAKKIAVTAVVTDEDAADYGLWLSYVSAELTRIVIDAENDQVLNGDGVGEDLQGLLGTTGILTRAVAADTALDALEQAFTDLRVGAAKCPATFAVLHPTTFSKVRRAKDTQGRYLLTADPSADEVSKLWGVPVVLTTTIATGTALVGNAQAATAAIRQGLTVQADFGAGGFEHNTTTLRAEERLMLLVPRPTALIKVTGL